MSQIVIVAGSVTQRVFRGGHVWVFLQYLLGFKRLGLHPVFVDHIDSSMLPDVRSDKDLARSTNVVALSRIMQSYGIEFCVLDGKGAALAGMERAELDSQAASSLFLLNVNGFLKDDSLLAATQQRVFLDIDPGFGQMWKELGLHDMFAGYDTHVTIGLNIGRPDCLIPTVGIDWITTNPPIVLDEWPHSPMVEGPVTTIATWRGRFGPIEYKGKTYGLRVHEFRKFTTLPRVSGSVFEIALEIDEGDSKDVAALQADGWRMVDPQMVSSDIFDYQRFIQGSFAELMIAKNMYVDTRSGWFSDRSVCYLASGRPVVAQDTGFAEHFPCEKGLFAFSAQEEAIEALDSIASDPLGHSRAAREIAEEYFDSDKVLGRLIEAIGV